MEMNVIWYNSILKMSKIFGEPLPKELLSFGDFNSGWAMKLNATDEEIEKIPPFEVMPYWGGIPAGLLGANGGMMADGSHANEDAFLEWLEQ